MESNRGEPLSFINTGVSARIKVQPTSIAAVSCRIRLIVVNNRLTRGYYDDSRVGSSCEATLISNNCTHLRKRYTDGREVHKPVHAASYYTRSNGRSVITGT